MNIINDKFPDGKLNADDDGATHIAMFIKDGRIVFDFMKPVTWFALDKESAQKLVKRIENYIEKI